MKSDSYLNLKTFKMSKLDFQNLFQSIVSRFMLDACKKHDILIRLILMYYIKPHPLSALRGQLRYPGQASRAGSHVWRFIGVRPVKNMAEIYTKLLPKYMGKNRQNHA